MCAGLQAHMDKIGKRHKTNTAGDNEIPFIHPTIHLPTLTYLSLAAGAIALGQVLTEEEVREGSAFPFSWLKLLGCVPLSPECL